MEQVMKQHIYFLPGYGSHLNTGLGQFLIALGLNVTGRETVGEFRDLGFSGQVQAIANDLRDPFWREDARVIANSFGAYLFLHAQALLGEPYIGKVLLISPIVGEFSNEDSLLNFVPPKSEKLFELAKAGNFPAPLRCEIHTGSDDWQSHPKNVTVFGEMTGLKVEVIPGAGHRLSKTYIALIVGRLMHPDL
jgi:hypothetical protein